MTKKCKVLQPLYFQNFKCTGAACEDNCCDKWAICVNKNTYQKYKNCPDAELRLKLVKNITRNRSASGPEDYAKIKLSKDKICPFFDEDKLCVIQRRLGEEYLSKVCTTYPRRYNLVNGILEKSLNVSCPEAARIVLLNTGLMEFELTEQDINLEQIMVSLTIDSYAKENKHNKIVQYFEELRIFTISILQTRCYPLWQRVVILGLFYDKLDKLIENNEDVDILGLIEKYRNYLEQEGELRDSLESIPVNPIIQVKIINHIFISQISDNPNITFRRILEEALQGLGYSKKCSEEEISARYVLINKNYYQPVADKYEYIIENYLVNYVFMNLLPYGFEKRPFDVYIMLVSSYACIKTLLIGLAGFYKEEFNVAHMSEIIQSFAKVVEHNNQYLQAVFNFLKNNNFDNMAYMSILIKN